MNPLSAVPVAETEIQGLPLWLSGDVNIRRDLYLFVKFVEKEGLRRSHRENLIPKGPALKLAKILSWKKEEPYVRENNHGKWSDTVSRLARSLHLVTFDVEGVYAGHTSAEPSFPDNEIEINKKRFSEWLELPPLEKEKAILDVLVKETESEFFYRCPLQTGDWRFSTHGSAIGPASRMSLPTVRLNLLRLLAGLPVNVWFSMSSMIDALRIAAPKLILDPILGKVPLTDWERTEMRRGKKVQEKVEDLYSNFRERHGDPYSGTVVQLAASTPDGFRRVEGRYLQYFLQGIPFLCGFVDVALAGPGEEKVFPPLEAVRAFRVNPKLRQVVNGEKELNKVSVTVLPTFEILVEAPSWPERQIDELSPFCTRRKEDGPIHVFCIETKLVAAYAAAHPDAPSPLNTLAQLCHQPIPHNVEVEIEAALGHSEKLTVYEKLALVEILNPDDEKPIVGELGKLAVDSRPEGFVLSRKPDETLSILEQRLRVPSAVKHSGKSFSATAGRLFRPVPDAPAAPKTLPRRKARLTMEDLAAYRASDPALLAELHAAVERAGGACKLLASEKLLLVSASDIPTVRSALEKLAAQWDVTIENVTVPPAGKKTSRG